MSTLVGKLNWGAWLYGLWVAVVGGAATAVWSTFGVSLMDPTKYNLASSGAIHDTIRLVLTIFTVNAIALFFAYIAKHPAPEWNGVPTASTFVDETGAERMDRRGADGDGKSNGAANGK